MDLKKRLNSVVKKDKHINPQYLINVIKSDFYYLISNYFEVDFEDVEVEIACNKDKYEISIDCVGSRMKILQTIP